ncbi:TlpA family protein disulfide reductase [Tundrisphaera lichenicola]|uniref:TlpA family protein disulfide reductase n=1 Tax=Tundrisphaera lichenicola TaxID=2029860 RepID=UPI003EB6CA30
MDLLKQYDQDGSAQPGGPKIGPRGFAERCLAIAARDPKIRLLSLVEAIRRAPDTPEASVAVDQFIGGYAANPNYLIAIDQMLIYSPNRMAISAGTTERLLLALLDKSPNRSVKGLACYCLAVCFQARTEGGVVLDPRDLDSSLDRSIGYFERASSEYADVESQGTTVGELSRVEIRFLKDLRPGRVAPTTRCEGLFGGPLDLTDYRGKVVLLSFWATWCGPCMAAIPREREMVRRYEGRPFQLLGVNGDDDIEKAVKAVTQKEITWPSFRNGGFRGPLSDQWHVSAWPTLYLIDHKGVIRRRFVDFPDEKELDILVGSLITECEGDRSGGRKPK